MRIVWSVQISGLIVASLLLVMLVSTARAGEPTSLVCDIWPPYQMRSPQGVTGFSVDVVNAVYKRMGVSIDKIEAFPWKRALEMVQHDNAQALFSANFSRDREVFALYPNETLIESPWIIWTRRRDHFTTLDDLKGKRIGVVLGYSYTPEFWEFIEIYCSVKVVHSDDINFKKLSAGRLDATIAEYGNGYFLSQSLKLDNLKPNFDLTIKEDGLYVLFNRKSVPDNFVEKFSNTLKAYKSTDEYSELRKKHFGSQSY